MGRTTSSPTTRASPGSSRAIATTAQALTITYEGLRRSSRTIKLGGKGSTPEVHRRADDQHERSRQKCRYRLFKVKLSSNFEASGRSRQPCLHRWSALAVQLQSRYRSAPFARCLLHRARPDTDPAPRRRQARPRVPGGKDLQVCPSRPRLLPGERLRLLDLVLECGEVALGPDLADIRPLDVAVGVLDFILNPKRLVDRLP